MSIINDAIKKARREFEVNNKAPAMEKDSLDKTRPSIPISSVSTAGLERSDAKWITVIVVSLVFMVSLMGAVFLYGYLSRLRIEGAETADGVIRPEHGPFSETRKNLAYNRANYTKAANDIELNGIVYGPGEKWAVINDKITKEGDFLPGGRLIYIAENFVRIKKDTGAELILELK